MKLVKFSIVKEGYIITIATLANFLSINLKDIETIKEVSNSNSCSIYTRLKRKDSICPYCHNDHLELKEWKKRILKHALFMPKTTFFYLLVPRYKCKSCGKTFLQSQNYSPKRSRLSHETIYLILKELQKYNQTFASVAELFHLSSTTIQNVFDTYINPPRGTFPLVMSIDEAYNKNQFSFPYSVILFDFLQHKIIDVIQDRKKSRLFSYFSTIHKKEREKVKYFIMDMWQPYYDIVSMFFPNAIIAIDSFHVMQILGRAMDSFRCRIMRYFSTSSDEYYLLKKFPFLLKEEFSPSSKKKMNYKFHMFLSLYDLQQMILKIHPDIRPVFEFYISYKNMNQFYSKEEAEDAFDSIVCRPSIASIPEFQEVISTLIHWKPFILNSFIVVEGYRLSNGPIEGMNSQLKKLFIVGNGLSNFPRFRARLMHCYNLSNSYSPVYQKVPKIKQAKRGSYKTSLLEYISSFISSGALKNNSSISLNIFSKKSETFSKTVEMYSSSLLNVSL